MCVTELLDSIRTAEDLPRMSVSGQDHLPRESEYKNGISARRWQVGSSALGIRPRSPSSKSYEGSDNALVGER